MREISGNHQGAGLRVGIVASRFNKMITSRLIDGALEGLKEAGVDDASITLITVPGAFELAGAAERLAANGSVDAVVCLGAVIRGETEHFTFVGAAAQQGVLRASLDSAVPMTFGVLTTDSVEQALERSGGDRGNKGRDAALDAVEMATLYRSISR